MQAFGHLSPRVSFSQNERELGARGDRMAQAVQALLTPATPPQTLVFLRQLGEPEIDALLSKMGFP